VARMISVLILALLAMSPLAAQIIVQPAGKSVPQAKTREELDAFGMVLDADSPQSTLVAAARFRELFAKSEFYEYACVAQMQAAMQLSKVKLAEETASAVLALNPNNPEALLTLAETSLPGLAAGEAETTAASQYAHRALDRIHVLSLPPFSDSVTWLRTKRSMLARAHLVLGQVSAEQGQLKNAESELQTAVDLAPSGKAYLLLSKIYAETNQTGRALTAARKALSLGPAAVAEMADREIKILDKKNP
jgi:tetratricopeptide (TPR) repeat protein